MKKSMTIFGRFGNARRNYMLCRRYPFLRPWNRFSGKLVRPYDYSYTELDALPTGWYKRFGLLMCKELRSALIGDDDLDRWRIVQIKEKYGELRLYDNGHNINSAVPSIINKYTLISRYTCVCCGNDATKVTLGWVLPYCDDCCPDENAAPIGEYYKEEYDLE